MAYVDAASPPPTLDFVRWSGCAAVVLAAHALLALLIASRTLEENVDAGAPVVLVELAPVAVAPPAPNNDVAPGPQQTDVESQERVSEKTKPEQKPQEPELKREPEEPVAPNPTVVLPPPVSEVSKQPEEVAPEPREAAPVPTAPPAVTAPAERPATPAVGVVARPSAAAIASWQRQLMAHLERHKRFPPEAHGAHGIATLAFSIDRNGRLLASRIVGSSGSPVLDSATLEMIRRASPLPPPPTGMSDGQLSFTLPIRYKQAR
jgi:protein TonB